MKNIQKTKDWIEMAIDDMKDAIADFSEERYPSSVFHSQQCAEKLLKSVLYFFGVFHEKTHFPSDVLVEEILNRPETTRDLSLSRDRIIKLSEIYDEEKAREIMGRSKTVLAAALGFFATLGAEELDGVLERIEQCLKR